MKTLRECYDIITSLNDEAHSYAYDLWTAADDMDDEDAEEQRCIASEAQNEFFVELFEQLDEETQKACFHYCTVDEDFKMDFECWYGEITE